jgi:hypothetical protein
VFKYRWTAIDFSLAMFLGIFRERVNRLCGSMGTIPIRILASFPATMGKYVCCRLLVVRTSVRIVERSGAVSQVRSRKGADISLCNWPNLHKAPMSSSVRLRPFTYSGSQPFDDAYEISRMSFCPHPPLHASTRTIQL